MPQRTSLVELLNLSTTSFFCCSQLLLLLLPSTSWLRGVSCSPTSPQPIFLMLFLSALILNNFRTAGPKKKVFVSLDSFFQQSDSNLGRLGAKRERYLCAMPSPRNNLAVISSWAYENLCDLKYEWLEHLKLKGLEMGRGCLWWGKEVFKNTNCSHWECLKWDWPNLNEIEHS